MTFNILCKTHDLEARMKGLTKLISDYEVDIVAIQENTDSHQQLLLKDPYIRKNFNVSDFTGQETGFKVSFLSRNPIMSLSIHSTLSNGRPALIAQFKHKDKIIKIACVHLVSGNLANARAMQLDFMYD